jgi:hypothetical protein
MSVRDSILSYESRSQTGRFRWKRLSVAATVVAALIGGWLLAAPSSRGRRQSPGRETEELTEAGSLGVVLERFARANGGRFPDRLEEVAAVGAFDWGRRLKRLNPAGDSGPLAYRISGLKVEYFGAGQRMTGSRDVVIARGISSVRPNQVYEICSDARSWTRMRQSAVGEARPTKAGSAESRDR